MLRDRLFETLTSEEEIDDSGFDVAMTALTGGALGPGWRTTRQTERGSACTSGRWGAGSGDVTGLAFATGDGTAAWISADDVDPADQAALADWLGDEAAQGPARRQGPDAGASRLGCRWGLSATPRCRRTSPAPTSAPTTWPTWTVRYLKRELKQGAPTTGS